MPFSVLPWNLKSWRSAFRVTGLPGIALFCLLLGAMLQVEEGYKHRRNYLKKIKNK